MPILPFDYIDINAGQLLPVYSTCMCSLCINTCLGLAFHFHVVCLMWCAVLHVTKRMVEDKAWRQGTDVLALVWYSFGLSYGQLMDVQAVSDASKQGGTLACSSS